MDTNTPCVHNVDRVHAVNQDLVISFSYTKNVLLGTNIILVQ